jgi:platelet-activating factor acetylhydrolase
MRLASEGRVVIAIEHRDGTGPAVFPRGRTILYINPDEVEWPDTKPVDPELGDHAKGAHNSEQALRLRVDQLDLRRREVYEIVHAFSALVSGAADHGGLSSMDGKNVDWSTWSGKVEVDQLDLIGHSFGGATLVRAECNGPWNDAHDTL